MPEARFRFEGVVGERIRANIDHWLLHAPRANPGLLEMFRLRDRRPVPRLVPWAGEFVGKYLLSAIEALQQSDRADLRATVSQVIDQLLATQAQDGYLGPFPETDRLKGNWDLWGHYHCLLALLRWHELTGDARALAACRRMADLMCATFLDGTRRVYDAGSPEMNMAVIHGLGRLYLVTRAPRYLRLMREIEKDWERAGDYLRAGQAGVEFFQSPRPRWESLHDLQGLAVLYEITGEAHYREAFEQHWRSIVRWDRRNTGAFSSGEQATGNPYEPTAIETCCTVAWMALTLDMLRLGGEARVADELELSTLNAAAGAQHPSGYWWTYNTPMDGAREASAHTIVFQARAGTPDLNCCSVNGPRALGLLSEWALMRAADGVALNWYGPMRVRTRLADGTPLAVRVEGDYPRDGRVRVVLSPKVPRKFSLRLRLPAWSKTIRVAVNGRPVPASRPGGYLALDRRWSPGDRVELAMDLGLRSVAGAQEMAGKVSLYRGPLLLAYDQRHNRFDEDVLPALALARLSLARMVRPTTAAPGDLASQFAPWVLVDVPGAEGRSLRLCDFASAGATGTRYRSWLAALDAGPRPVVTRLPRDGASIARGRALFRWRPATSRGGTNGTYTLRVRAAGGEAPPVLVREGLGGDRVVLEESETRWLSGARWWEWEVSESDKGNVGGWVWPPARFRVDASLPRVEEGQARVFLDGTRVVLVSDALAGHARPEPGRLVAVQGVEAAAGRQGEAAGAVRFDGVAGRITYAMDEFPEADYSVVVWVRLQAEPEGRLGQVFSAWARGMDDPLRVCVERGKVYARIEAGQGYSTPGLPITTGAWHHLAAIKEGSTLALYLDGQAAGRAAVPAWMTTATREVALGGNPRFEGNEYLAMEAAEFRFLGRALSVEEIRQAARFDNKARN
jgi:DUF1680 family protein